MSTIALREAQPNDNRRQPIFADKTGHERFLALLPSVLTSDHVLSHTDGVTVASCNPLRRMYAWRYARAVPIVVLQDLTPLSAHLAMLATG